MATRLGNATKSTSIGAGAHDFSSWPSSDSKTPSDLSIADGTTTNNSTETVPVVTMGRQTSATLDANTANFHLYTINNDNAPVATFRADAIQRSPVSEGLLAIYGQVVADYAPKTGTDSVSSFPFWASIQRWAPSNDITGMELNPNEQYSRTVTGVANNGAGLIRITVSLAHGLKTGHRVRIADVGGVTAANGIWTVTAVTTTTFDLQSSTFSGTYTSGGTVYYCSAPNYDGAYAGMRSVGVATVGYGNAPHTTGFLTHAAVATAKFYAGYTVDPNTITKAADYTNQATGVAFWNRDSVPSLRSPNNQPLQWRNAADSAWVDAIKLNASDVVEFTGGLKASGSLTERGRSVALGEPIDIAHSAGNFTANTGSWTVDSGDQATLTYSLEGKKMTLAFAIVNTDVSAAATDLRIALPAGFTVSAGRTVDNTYWRSDAGGTYAVGMVKANPGDAFIRLYKDPVATPWTITSSDNTSVRGEITFWIS